MNEEPRLIYGAMAVDDRGVVAFVNDFDFPGVKRYYLLSNHRPGFVRAWHGHRYEAKFVTVVQGAALVCLVKIDDWVNPSKDLTVHRYAMSAGKPAVLYAPPGYANGIMSLTDDAKIMCFSTATVDESRVDDIRFDSRYWDPWTVEER